MVERRPRQLCRNVSARTSALAAEPMRRTEMTWPDPGGDWFETSTPWRTPMFGPPAQITAFTTCEPVNVAVHDARGFAGEATLRSPGSGTAARYGCVASGVQTQVDPLRMTRLPQQPNSSV